MIIRLVTLFILLCTNVLFSLPETASTDTVQRVMKYAQGHETFKSLFYKLHEKEFVRLVHEGQAPKTLFIGCSDSRVIPELIASAMPGELFVIRTAGNFVPFYESNNCMDGVAASLQYAVEVLNVTDIIICGHSHCGAIKGLFAKKDPTKTSSSPNFLEKWLLLGEEAKKFTLVVTGSTASTETQIVVAEQLSILYQLEHLLTYPFVKERVNAGRLFLHGWFFSIETGNIEYYDPETYQFLPLK